LAEQTGLIETLRETVEVASEWRTTASRWLNEVAALNTAFVAAGGLSKSVSDWARPLPEPPTWRRDLPD
jgi:hypothetical protein